MTSITGTMLLGIVGLGLVALIVVDLRRGSAGVARNLLRRAFAVLWFPIDRLLNWAARLGWLRRSPVHAGNDWSRFGRRLFDNAGEPWLRPRIRTDHAPTAPWAEQSVVAEGGDAVDPRVRTLRRAAVTDMFDQVGLEIVPGQLWKFVDDSLWVDRAVDHFLTLLGLDVDALHRREATALALANDVLELLIDVESAFARLSPSAVATIEDAIFSGEYERVREAARIVSIYETISRLGDRWPEEIRFAAFTAFLHDVRAELADPLSSTLDDAEEAERFALRMAGLMQRFDHALRVQDLWLTALRNGGGGWETWPEAGQIIAAVNLFHRLTEQICAETFIVEEMDDFIARLEEINGELESIFARHEPASPGAGGRRDRDSGPPPADSDSVLDEVEKALVFFGFERDEKPSRAEIKKRLAAARHETHPDKGGSSEAFQEVQRHWDVLKSVVAA